MIHRRGSMGWLLLSSSISTLWVGEVTIADRIVEIVGTSPEIGVLIPGSSLLPESADLIADLESFFDADIATVNADEATDAKIQQSWYEASLMILLQGNAIEWREILGKRVFDKVSDEIVGPDSIVFGIGESIAAMGRWTMDLDASNIREGLSWIENAILLPGEHTPGSLEPIKEHLLQNEGSYAVGMPKEALLAIGPEDRVEVWSQTAPVITMDMTS